MLQDRRAIEIVERFIKLVMWRLRLYGMAFAGLVQKEIYSGYEPSWDMRAASIWLKMEMKELSKLQEILKSSNVDEDLGYISEEIETFTWLILK